MCMSAFKTVCNTPSHNFIWGIMGLYLSPTPPLGPGVKSGKLKGLR